MASHDRLTRQERLLLHQVHPAKLATDISVSVVSTVLFWRHRLVPGLLVFAVPAPVASAVVLRRDLSGYRDSAAGRYVLAHMPPSMQAVRAAGAVAMAVGSWRRRPALIVAGLALVGLGWSHGLLRPRATARPGSIVVATPRGRHRPPGCRCSRTR
jgi:hypothetical protein